MIALSFEELIWRLDVNASFVKKVFLVTDRNIAEGLDRKGWSPMLISLLDPEGEDDLERLTTNWQLFLMPEQKEDLDRLSAVLEGNTVLEQIFIYGTDESGGGNRDPYGDPRAIAACLAKAVDVSANIFDISISSIQIDRAGAALIGEVIGRNSSLTEITFFDCEIDDSGVAELADGLSRNSSIKMIDLAVNKFGPEGAEALAGALLVNSTLKTLDICSNCLVGNEGVAAIIGALHHNQSLEHLTLEYICRSDDKGCLSEENEKRIIQMLGANHTLRSIPSAELCRSEDLGLDIEREDPRGVRPQIEALLAYNRMGPRSARARKMGECPPSWLERDGVPRALVPAMLGRIEKMCAGDAAAVGASVTFDFVRKHPDVMAVMKTQAERSSSGAGGKRPLASRTA